MNIRSKEPTSTKLTVGSKIKTLVKTQKIIHEYLKIKPWFSAIIDKNCTEYYPNSCIYHLSSQASITCFNSRPLSKNSSACTGFSFQSRPETNNWKILSSVNPFVEQIFLKKESEVSSFLTLSIYGQKKAKWEAVLGLLVGQRGQRRRTESLPTRGYL